MGRANAQSKDRHRSQPTPGMPKHRMTRKGCVLVGPPVRGECGWLANRGTSADGGWKLVSLVWCVFR